MWLQRTIQLEARPRGIHLVTGEVLVIDGGFTATT